MDLKEKLLIDFKKAMKNRDKVAKDTINLARAAIKQSEVDQRIELSDEEIIPILTKQVKMRRDALTDFEKAGRQDLIEAYNAEIKILEGYLPRQMDYDEIKTVVNEVGASLGITSGRENMGKLMVPVMNRIKEQADGNMVRKAVTEYLD